MKAKSKQQPPSSAEVAAIMRAIAYTVAKHQEEPTMTALLTIIMQSLAELNQNLSFIAGRIDEFVKKPRESEKANVTRN